MAGSGNYLRWGTKSTTSSQRRIDIRWLKKQDCLRPKTSGLLLWPKGGKQPGSINYRMEQDRMILNYRHCPYGGEWENVEQVISFDRTSCHYGGLRTWFLCPRCRQRVGLLYGVGKYFFCRHCYNLTYASQQVQRYERLIMKARTIRERLGGSANLLEPFPEKPKGMHWDTYQRLREESEQANHLSWLLIGKQFGFDDRWA